MGNIFPSPLKVEYINGRVWELVEPFTYHSKTELITVPKGFRTDFASIPRLFWSIIGHPTGRYGKAAIIHDFLYHTQRYSRSRSDRIFLRAMKALKVAWWKRRLMWAYVRLLGWRAWNIYKRIKREGVIE